MSICTSAYSILKALEMARYLGQVQGPWQPSGANQLQQVFLNQIYPVAVEQAVKYTPDIEATATQSPQQLAQWFAQRGFNIQLNWSPPNFGTGAILNVLAEYETPGTARKMVAKNGQTYDSVFMPTGRVNLLAPPQRYQNNPESVVVVTRTKNPGDHLWIMKSSDRPANTLDLIVRGAEILSGSHPMATAVMAPSPVASAEWPMVDLNQDDNIKWMQGIHGTGMQNRQPVPIILAEAVQKNVLKMNEAGARVKSATAMSFLCGAAAKPQQTTHIKIDEPFYFMLVRRNMSLPYFCAYVDYADWKKPQDLS